MVTANDTLLAQAFSRGSDARIAGAAETDNPYTLASHEWHAWLQGHRHCSMNWGVGARGRWRVKPLPEVGTVMERMETP